MDYAQKKWLLLGLGESNLAAAYWLIHCGATVRVADTRPHIEQTPNGLALQAAAPDTTFFSGPFKEDLLEDMDGVVVSPGLSPHGDLIPLLPVIEANNLPLLSEIGLFTAALNHLRETRAYTPQIIAITGTNGKTTVTRLAGLLVARAGKSVRVAGNISPALLHVLLACVKNNTLPDVWVLELSSFQLHYAADFVADVATVLNVTPDHLDWHGSMEEYIADKARIFSSHTIQILNRDDPTVMRMHNKAAVCYTVGVTAPTSLREWGLLEEGGLTWLAVAESLDEMPSQSKIKRKAVSSALASEVHIHRLMPTEALKIEGKHNAMNALVALALCRALHLPLAPLLHGLQQYRGEPHRVAWVNTVKEVAYYDDSKGTNVYATLAALCGLSRLPHKIWLIAGGVGKGQDFAPLKPAVEQHVGGVFLIGEATNDIIEALSPTAVLLKPCPSLEEAVHQAAHYAQPQDIVLLSPACASFDMFQNYQVRGQQFASIVTRLAAVEKKENHD